MIESPPNGDGDPIAPRLPRGWQWFTGGDLFSFITSGSRGWARYYSETGPLFLRVGNLDHASIQLDLSDIQRVTPPSGAEAHRTRVVPNDVLISVTADVGMVAVVPQAFEEAFISQHVALCRPFPGFDVRFVAWFLSVESGGLRQFRALQRGATKLGLGLSDIAAVRIPLAPQNEQRRIVEKIEELFSDLDAGAAALDRARANLKRYRASILKAAVDGSLTAEWRAKHPKVEPASKLLERILKERRRNWEAAQLVKFAAVGKQPVTNWQAKYVEPTPPEKSDLPDLPKGWCWASVEQIGEVQGGIQKQPSRLPASNAFPYLRVANVHRNRLDLSEIHKIELFGKELERLRLQPGDMLIVEGNGSKTEIGRSAIWGGEIENCVHQNHIIRVRFFAGDSRYLNSYWNSPLGNGRVMELAASTSGLYTLSVAKVCSLPIPLPPFDDQVRCTLLPAWLARRTRHGRGCAAWMALRAC